MTPEQARDAVLGTLARIAPEIEPGTIEPEVDLRDEVGLDSIDFLSLVADLADRTGVQIPEADYPQVRSLSGLVGYLVGHAA